MKLIEQIETLPDWLDAKKTLLEMEKKGSFNQIYEFKKDTKGIRIHSFSEYAPPNINPKAIVIMSALGNQTSLLRILERTEDNSTSISIAPKGALIHEKSTYQVEIESDDETIIKSVIVFIAKHFF